MQPIPKMRKSYLILILIFSISCTNKISKQQIDKFEEILGKQNSNELTLLVTEFEENILKKKYPSNSLKKSYDLLFLDIKTNGINIADFQTKKGQDIFTEGKLKTEIYRYPDSVWVENDLIKMEYRDKLPNGTFYSGISTMSGGARWKFQTLDSLISYQMNMPTHNSKGKYWKAMQEIKKGNDFLEGYYEHIEQFGPIPVGQIPDIIRLYKIDPTNYLIKRILIREMMY